MQLVSGYLSYLAQSSLEHRSLLRDFIKIIFIMDPNL
jgi:hypothetical protein